MNLFHLRYFVELAHTRHYTRAAEHLCITQPSLSHAIAQLERELGVPLFEKNGRNTNLTQYGEQFLTCAQQTLTTLDEGVESLRRVAHGEGLIRLGLLRTLGVDFLPDLAARFLEANPGKDIRFSFSTGVTQQLLDGLAAKRFDLVFCSQPSVKLGFTSIPVSRQDLVLIVPRGHPLASRHVVDLQDVLPYPQLCPGFRSAGRGGRTLRPGGGTASNRLRDRRRSGHRRLGGPELRYRRGALHGYAPAAGREDSPDQPSRLGAELLYGQR